MISNRTKSIASTFAECRAVTRAETFAEVFEKIGSDAEMNCRNRAEQSVDGFAEQIAPMQMPVQNC